MYLRIEQTCSYQNGLQLFSLFDKNFVEIKHAPKKTFSGQFSKKRRLTSSSTGGFPSFFFRKSDIMIPDYDKCRPRIFHHSKFPTKKIDQSENCGHEIYSSSSRTLVQQRSTSNEIQNAYVQSKNKCVSITSPRDERDWRIT